MGTFAVTSLMVYSTVNRIESEFSEIYKLNDQMSNNSLTDLNQTSSNTAYDPQALKIKISTGLAFWCGIFQVNQRK